MTVAELQAKLSRDELLGWMAFHRIEPFGSLHDDYRFGVVGSIIANKDRPKELPAITNLDLFPPYTEEEKQILLNRKIDALFTDMMHRQKD